MFYYFQHLFKNIPFITVLLIALSCVSKSPAITNSTIKNKQPIAKSQAVSGDKKICNKNNSNPFDSKYYTIKQDENIIGTEVRSTYPYSGTMGEEKIIVSHIVKHYKINSVEIDRFTVKAQRFLENNNTFLRGSTVEIDESKTKLFLVGFNGDGWEKVSEIKDSISSPIKSRPFTVPLHGDEIIGFNLVKYMKSLKNKKSKSPSKNYYQPTMTAPVQFDFLKPKENSFIWNNIKKEGVFITAVRKNRDRIIRKIFIDKKTGMVLQEQSPAIHQTLILQKNLNTKILGYANPYGGLFSKNYLGLPEISTTSKFKISSSQNINIDKFKFIELPKNQSLKKIDSNTYILTVKKGAPDGSTLPKPEDTMPSSYINSDSKIIKNALLFLKTGGKKGRLPEYRKENAIPVAARASRLDIKEFWNSPKNVASLIREYVHALLPDKHHTHTMKDAVTALHDGLGDCTEHSVLFAALMRAANIPTRLVSGMYLGHGGSWEFHMWNEYWDDGIWQSIDTTLINSDQPGANYVALGLGASDFKEHRNNLVFFLDRSFSGLQFDLISSGANGEALHLVKSNPKFPHGNDAVMFEAMTLVKRGNYKQAYNLIINNYKKQSAPLNMELLLGELQFLNKKYDATIKNINYLKTKTSLKQNILLLTTLEFKTCLALKSLKKAKKNLEKLAELLGSDSPSYILQKVKYLNRSDSKNKILPLLESILINYPDNSSLMTAYCKYTADFKLSKNIKINDITIKKAQEYIKKAIYNTYYADPDVLKAAARLSMATKNYKMAEDLLNHIKIMRPDDEELKQWDKELKKTCY